LRRFWRSRLVFRKQNQQKIMEENGIWYRYNQQLWWYGWKVWKILHSNNPKDDSTSVEMAIYIMHWLGVIWVSPAAHAAGDCWHGFQGSSHRG
jgi:hypothetical protein